MDQESSLELVRRIKSGDAAALEKLLSRYRPRLKHWASGRLPRYARDMTDTDDLIQEVMIGTIRNLDRFEVQGDWALQGYLRTAVTNRIRDELRRKENRPVRVELDGAFEASDASPLEEAMGREVFAQYDRALAGLKEDEREAVIARLELECSYAEIAQLLGKATDDAARMFVVRAVAKLARLMS